MVQVGNTVISMSEIADTLLRGDVITHCYTPQKPSIIDEQGKLLPEVRKAKERGVIFDVGHAGGHFDFNLVRRAMGEGIVPDIISSDLHGRLSQPGFGVVGDLLTTLTKFLPLGLTFDEIIAKCTTNPARVIGWQDRLGTLEVGREADIAVPVKPFRNLTLGGNRRDMKNLTLGEMVFSNVDGDAKVLR